MDMQKVERTGDKVDRTGNIVAGSVSLTKVVIFVESRFDIRLYRQFTTTFLFIFNRIVFNRSVACVSC